MQSHRKQKAFSADILILLDPRKRPSASRNLCSGQKIENFGLLIKPLSMNNLQIFTSQKRCFCLAKVAFLRCNMQHFGKQKHRFCHAKRSILQCKTHGFATQRPRYCMVRERKRVFHTLHSGMRNSRLGKMLETWENDRMKGFCLVGVAKTSIFEFCIVFGISK